MLNIDIDFYTYTINHPEYLKATYNNFVKYCQNYDLSRSTLYLNIDPYPNQNQQNIEQIISIANSFFGNVICRIPTKCGITEAFYWGMNQIKTDYFFLLYCFVTHSGKCIKRAFDLEKMYNSLSQDTQSCQICLITSNEKYINYLTCCPTLWKYNYIKNVYLKYANVHIQERYALRELALLENIKGLHYDIDIPGKYYSDTLKDFNKFEYQLGYPIIQNISSDVEIQNIIHNNGEWHQKTYQLYKHKKNVNKKTLHNLFKKTLDIEWILRWTGVFSFVPKKQVNPNNRMYKKSVLFKCNQ